MTQTPPDPKLFFSFQSVICICGSARWQMSVSEITCNVSALFDLPHTAGKVCGYEVSWTIPSLVPYMQTVPCVHPPKETRTSRSPQPP